MKDELFRKLINVLSFGLLYFIRSKVKKRKGKSPKLDRFLDVDGDGDVTLGDMHQFHLEDQLNQKGDRQ